MLLDFSLWSVVFIVLDCKESLAQTSDPWSAWSSSWSSSSWAAGSSDSSSWSGWSSSWSSWTDSSGSASGNAVDDVGNSAGSSAVAQSVLKNSANLTRQNAKCNELISQNLQNHTDMKNTQPVVPTTIDMKFILINLNEIDDASGTLSMTARIDFRWYDRRLSLGPNTTCAGETLLVHTTDIWFPYFIIQNGANDVFYPDAWEKFPSALRADGYISWRVAFKLDLACDMDFTIFPFDRQYCKVLIQSPHYGEGELNYTVADETRGMVVFDSSSADHPMWTLEGQAVKYTTKVPGLVFWIALQRKYTYYIWTIAIPVLAVCILTASTFIVPANGEEKLSTVINGLLSFFLLYLMFVTAIPQTSSNIPYLMIFFSVQILLTTVQVVLCSVILRLLGLEQAEEEMAENEAEEERNGDHAARRLLDASGSSGQHVKQAGTTRNLYNSKQQNTFGRRSNSVSPTLVNPIKIRQLPPPEEPKKRCITAHWLNEITLGVYLGCVVISILGFVGAMARVYKTQEPDIDYYEIEKYRINE